MVDCVASLGEREHALVCLLRAYKPIALLCYLPDAQRALFGYPEGPNVGVWLSDEIPCSEYFVHFLRICSMIDEVFDCGYYRPVVLNSAPPETRRLFVQHGCSWFARRESDRVSLVIAANSNSYRPACGVRQKRWPASLCSKIVSLGSRALERRCADRRGLLIDFRPPTVRA
jgi:hypothetical protein